MQLQRSAATIAWPQRATRSVFSQGHPLGIQTLAMEPAHQKNPAAPRHARIYQFDHDRVLARHLVIALDDARVLVNQVVTSVHLPLNAAERDWVTMQLLATSWLQDAAEGDLSSLQPSTFVFEPVDPNAHCHVSRCALVSLARSDGTVLTVEPVVEFATGVVRPLDATSTSRRP